MPKPIDRDEVGRLAAGGAQVVEVLPTADYEQEHIPGAIPLPLKELDRSTADAALDRERAVVVYCYDTQ